MKHMKDNKGYALLITLAVIILFTALGMTMLALASSGTKKNIIRQEAVQATALSEKGIDQISAQINRELTKELGENGLPRGEFILKLENTLNNYKCSSTLAKQKSDTGSFGACIESFTDVREEKGELNELRKLVKFKSTGNTGNAERFLTSDIEIGAETVPETLKYAVGTNIMSKNPKNGEGNLLMHGGVEVQGDLKVDGNILTRNYGYAYLSGEKWIESLPPAAKPTPGSKSSKIVLGKSSFTLNSNKSYSTHISTSDFPSTNGYTKQFDIKNLFRPGSAPQVVKREPIRSPIGISDQKEVFKFERNDSGVELLLLNSNRIIQSQTKQHSMVFPTYAEKKQGNCISWGRDNWNRQYCKEYEYYFEYNDRGNYELSGTNSFRRLSTLGNLEIKDTKTNASFQEGLYVEGNLSIGNNSTSYNPRNYSDITLEGPMFVNGDVTIKGANLQSNVLLYVNGSVDIQYSTLNGKPLSNKRTGSFIIFAKGGIKFSNNSVNQDTPSLIRGFFYSEEDLEMFGVGSNIKIEGGISARRIVLNAIRGRASDSKFSGAQYVGGSYFEGVSNQQTSNSRLQIIYDPEIVSTFSDLRQQEPIIYKVDPPVEKNRQVVN